MNVSYLVENLKTMRAYRVESKNPSSLDMVWDSQKYMFNSGAMVKITDPFGNYKVFQKE